MGHHHKAASCSALPSFQSFTSISTSSTKAPSLFDHDYKPQQQSTSSTSTANLKRSISPLPTSTITRTNSSNQNSYPADNQQQQLFPLPSFCLYSKKALANEYAPESDIIQFLSPVSSVLEECLPMFVGVLQSLFTVVNDIPFINEDSDDEDDDISCSDTEEEDDDEDEEGGEDQDRDRKATEPPFTIIGLTSMKFIIWNNMYDNIMDTDNVYKKDLCLVVIVSNQLPDKIILENMNSLRRSVYSTFSESNAPVSSSNNHNDIL